MENQNSSKNLHIGSKIMELTEVNTTLNTR